MLEKESLIKDSIFNGGTVYILTTPQSTAVGTRRHAAVDRDSNLLTNLPRHEDSFECGRRRKEKERCSGSYCQAIGFLVIKDYSISERPG